MQFTIKQGMNQDILKSYPDNHFDSIVTDPPYGIEFLGKDWDSNTGAVETWEECYRVLKPGGHILAFSAARTYHKLATNIESVGFEIRDQLMWLYASGFPKAQDIGKAIDKRAGKRVSATADNTKNTYAVGISSKCTKCDMPHGTATRGMCKKEDCPINEALKPADNEWAGWKTALKPAHEPIVMARKPFKGSAVDNVLKHGTGALNIDATRIPFEGEAEAEADRKWREKWSEHNVGGPTFQGTDINQQRAKKVETLQGARASMQTGAPHFQGTDTNTDNDEVVWKQNDQGRFPSNVFGEVEDYQKYFYCPKVQRAERHVGFEQTNIPTGNNIGDGVYEPGTPGGIIDRHVMVAAMGGKWVDANGVHLDAYTPDANAKSVWLPHKGVILTHGLRHEYDEWCKDNNKPTGNVGNNHPTVKPVALMSYLVKLVTPEGGKVLDPFSGSGSTGMACVEHGFDYTGCELDPAYVEIATKRIEAWYKHIQPKNNYNELFDD